MKSSAEHVARLLRTANPVSEVDDAMRVVRATDPIWQTITARVQQEEHDMDPNTRSAPTQSRWRLVAVTAVTLLAAALGTWTVVGGDDSGVEPIGGTPPPVTLDIALTGPASDSVAGQMQVTGTAVDQGVACPAVSWSNSGVVRDDGTEVGQSSFLNLLSVSTELTWTEEYTCLDGSGMIEIRSDPLMTSEELGALDGQATEFATWSVVAGDGAFEGVTGEGVLVFDFTDSAADPGGAAVLRGELTFP